MEVPRVSSEILAIQFAEMFAAIVLEFSDSQPPVSLFELEVSESQSPVSLELHDLISRPATQTVARSDVSSVPC
jgi:hypothetical protein